MPYAKTTWTSGLPLTIARLNNLETQYDAVVGGSGVIPTAALAANAVSKVSTVEIAPTSSINSTSASFIDITGLTMSVTTTGGDLVVWLEGGPATGNSTARVVLGISVNGVDYPVGVQGGGGGQYSALAGHVVVTGLPAGTYTVKGRYCSSTGGAGGVTVLQYHSTESPCRARLTAIELKR